MTLLSERLRAGVECAPWVIDEIRELEAGAPLSEVTRLLLQRERAGLDKYGVTIDRADLSLTDWLQHMVEELMDGASYALRAKRELEASAQAAPIPYANDGFEQDAFERWARESRYDMRQHPMHWLFLDRSTYAARQGWRAALEYVATMTCHGGRPDVALLAKQVLDGINGLVSESEGIAGLHRNGEVAMWGEVLPGGQYERLSSLDDLQLALSGAKPEPFNLPDDMVVMPRQLTPGMRDEIRILNHMTDEACDTRYAALIAAAAKTGESA